MAKEKIRKLLKDQKLLNQRADNMLGMLAFLAHKEGGSITFTKEDLKTIPDAAFSINVKDGVYTLKLSYETDKDTPLNQS